MTARTEQSLQRELARFLDAALLPPAVWFHCPNGGMRSRIEAGIFQGIGVKAGVPDLVIVHACRVCFLELKSTTGRVSEAQRDMMSRLAAAGAMVAVAHSLDEAIAQLQEWDLPLRIHQGAIA